MSDMPQPKGIASMLVSKLGKDEPEAASGADSDDEIGKESCAEDCLAAMEAKDPKAFVQALSDLLAYLK